MNLRNGRCSPTEGLIPLMVKPQLVGAPSPAHPMEDCMSCLARSLQQMRISRTQELDSIPTTLQNSRVSLMHSLSFLRPAGPVARGSQACIFYGSKHAAQMRMGMIQSRTTVPLGLTSQQLLLQAQLRPRITMQHNCSHGQNVGNECADRAAALESFGLISNQNIRTRWVHSSH